MTGPMIALGLIVVVAAVVVFAVTHPNCLDRWLDKFDQACLDGGNELNPPHEGPDHDR